MAFADILTSDRVSVSCETEGWVHTKQQALERLSEMLASGQTVVAADRILAVLLEREQLSSTGVGSGVAVPHASVEELNTQIGALLVCPTPIDFDAVDDLPVSIVFALVGPKGAPLEHLKVLARMSRMLRKDSFRQALAASRAGIDAYQLITAAEPPSR